NNGNNSSRRSPTVRYSSKFLRILAPSRLVLFWVLKGLIVPTSVVLTQDPQSTPPPLSPPFLHLLFPQFRTSSHRASRPPLCTAALLLIARPQEYHHSATTTSINSIISRISRISRMGPVTTFI